METMLALPQLFAMWITRLITFMSPCDTELQRKQFSNDAGSLQLMPQSIFWDMLLD
jgi:hypothetical protein